MSVDVEGEKYSDTAFVTVASNAEQAAPTPQATRLVAVEPTGLEVPRTWMLGGVAAAGLGLLLLLLGAFGVLGGAKQDSIEARIAAYTRGGSRRLSKAQPVSQGGYRAGGECGRPWWWRATRAWSPRSSNDSRPQACR